MPRTNTDVIDGAKLSTTLLRRAPHNLTWDHCLFVPAKCKVFSSLSLTVYSSTWKSKPSLSRMMLKIWTFFPMLSEHRRICIRSFVERTVRSCNNNQKKEKKRYLNTCKHLKILWFLQVVLGKLWSRKWWKCSQWPGKLGFNQRSSHTKDSKK